MTPRQSLALALVALLIGLVILLEWASLPPSLNAGHPRTVSVGATLKQERGGRLVLREASGGSAEVRCGKLPPVCDRLRERAMETLVLRVVNVGLTGDTWILSAAAEGRELLDMGTQESAYAWSKAMHVALAAFFLVAAAALCILARLHKGVSISNAA